MACSVTAIINMDQPKSEERMILLPLFFFVLLVLTFAVLLMALQPSHAQKAMQLRVAEIRNPQRAPTPALIDAKPASSQRETLSQRLSTFLLRYACGARLERLILEADSPQAPGSLALRSLGYCLGSILLALLLSRSMLAGSACGVLGLCFPCLVLRYRRAVRLRTATSALPDTADLMARALRAGHSVSQAIEAMAERAPQPLSTEFARICQQQRLGVSLRDVLLELGRRIPSRDLHFMITAILVQRETGGDLADILQKTANLLRERIRVQGEVKVRTAQGRLTGWILSLMPLALLALISIFSPGYVHILFVDPVGRRLLYGGTASMVLGSAVIRKIVKVDY